MRRIYFKSIAAALIAVLTTVMSITFVFADDITEEINTEVNSLKLYGDSVVLDDTTIRYTLSKTWMGGSAWCNNKISTADDFTVTYNFYSGGRDSYYGGADGIVLNIAETRGLGPTGGDLGFLRGENNYGVELDSYQNTAFSDPYKKHVAIIKGTISNHITAVSEPRVDDSAWHDLKVEYLANSKELKVYIDGGKVLECGDVTLPEDGVYLGITSTTGSGFNVQKTSHFAIDGVECNIQPANVVLEDVREINGSGIAIAQFKLKDENGSPLKNTAITYVFDDNQVGQGKSDENGICNIIWETQESNKVLNPRGTAKKFHKKASIYIGTNEQNDVSSLTNAGYTVEMDIKVKPFSFSQTWEASTSASVTASIGPEAGIKIGPAEAKAHIAKAEAEGSAGVSMNLEHEYSEGQRNLKLGETFAIQVGVNGSIGPAADAKLFKEKVSVKAASLSAGASCGDHIGYGLNIPNYDPANSDHRKKIGRYLLGTEALSTGNVALLQLAQLLGFDIYNTLEYGSTASAEVGASLGEVEVGDAVSGSLASASAATGFELSEEINKDEKSLTSTMNKESAVSGGLGNIEFKITKDKKEYGNGGTIASINLLDNKYGIEAVFDEDRSNPQEVTISGMEGFSDVGLLVYHSSKEKDVEIKYTGNDLKQLCNDVPAVKKFVDDNPMFLFDSSFKNAWAMAEKSKAKASFEKSVTNNTTIAGSLGLGVKLGLGLGAEVGLAGSEETSYSVESGKYANGAATIYSASDAEGEIDKYKISLGTIITEPIVAIAEEAKNHIKSTVGKLGDMLKRGWAKITSKVNDVRNWTINLMEVGLDDFVENVRSVNTYSEDGIEENEEAAATGAANIIGKPYIVTVFDEDTKEYVQDFGEDVLTLSIGYSYDMLEAASAKANEDKLAIYKYNEKYCGYIYVGGVVNKDDKEVTVDISTPGQYILGADVTAPSVKEFKVSDSSSKPTIFVTMDEASDFNEFSMKLDGVEIINSDNWFSFYETQIKRFGYRCIKDLEEGKHKVVIEAADAAGNKMEPASFEFNVDVKAPESIHADESESIKGEVKPNDYKSAKKETQTVKKEKVLVVKQKLDIKDRLPAEKCKVSVYPKGVGTVSKGYFIAKKPCDQPIKLTAYKTVKGKKVILSEITLEETIVKPTVKKTVTRYNTGDVISANDIFSEGTPKVTSLISSKPLSVEADAEKGLLTIKENEKAKSVKVTAYIGNVKYVITVKIKIPTVSKLTVKNGKNKKIIVKNLVIPKVLSRTPSAYRSENPSIAAVDSNGYVTGAAIGETRVFVTVDGVEYPCIVKVTK